MYGRKYLHLVELGSVKGMMMDFSEAVSIQHSGKNREDVSTCEVHSVVALGSRTATKRLKTFSVWAGPADICSTATEISTYLADFYVRWWGLCNFAASPPDQQPPEHPVWQIKKSQTHFQACQNLATYMSLLCCVLAAHKLSVPLCNSWVKGGKMFSNNAVSVPVVVI